MTPFYPVENRKSCNGSKISVLIPFVPSKMCTTYHWEFWPWIFDLPGDDEGIFLTPLSDFSLPPVIFFQAEAVVEVTI